MVMDLCHLFMVKYKLYIQCNYYENKYQIITTNLEFGNRLIGAIANYGVQI